MAFEAVLSGQKNVPKAWRRVMFTGSIVVHGIALMAGVAHSMWQVDEMPMPAVEVTLSMAAPPPPPPPPPPKRKKAEKKPKPSPTKALVAPKEVQPEPETPPEPEDEGDDEGEEGGVEGGIAGGSLGGVAPPPPVNTGPKLLTMHAGNNLLAINPNQNPYKVRLPEELADSGQEFVAQVRICVNEQGNVSSVTILRPSVRPIDQQLPSVMGRWRYRPFIVDGKPTAFCYPLNYRVR